MDKIRLFPEKKYVMIYFMENKNRCLVCGKVIAGWRTTCGHGCAKRLGHIRSKERYQYIMRGGIKMRRAMLILNTDGGVSHNMNGRSVKPYRPEYRYGGMEEDDLY